MNGIRLSLAAACLIVWSAAVNAQILGDVVKVPVLPKPVPTFLEPKPAESKPADFVDNAFQRLGGYYTTSANRYLRQQIAADFTAGAATAGFSPAQTRSFADAIQSGQLQAFVLYPAGLPPAPRGVVSSPGATISYFSPQADFIFSFLYLPRLGVYVQSLSIIKLQVEPVPPRDYQVVINGETINQPPDESIYKVLPGNAAVSVTRAAIAPCIWHGPLTAGETQVVTCKLEQN
jgi:hypothetical protein